MDFDGCYVQRRDLTLVGASLVRVLGGSSLYEVAEVETRPSPRGGQAKTGRVLLRRVPDERLIDDRPSGTVR